jgi:hypothetical protein
VLFNHSNQWESLADWPGIDEEINHPIATTNSSQTTPINLDSSGLCQSTTMTNQHSTAHLCSASPQSFSSARKPISTICSFQYGFSSSMVQSLAVKVQVSSTTKVSRHAYTLLAFEPVTSTTKISLAKTALKATAEMQSLADICQYPGPLAEQPIAATNSSQYNSSADVGLHTARRNSKKMFQLIVRYVFTVRFKQQYQSKMQQDLGDFSSSKTISNSKLANNDFQLIVVLTLILNCEGLCAVAITSYSPFEEERNFSVFEGA